MPILLGAIPGPQSIITVSAAEFAKGKDTITMEFENAVLFTPHHGLRVQYTQGVHEVPRQYLNHWYLCKAGKAKVYTGQSAAAAVQTADISTPSEDPAPMPNQTLDRPMLASYRFPADGRH